MSILLSVWLAYVVAIARSGALSLSYTNATSPIGPASTDRTSLNSSLVRSISLRANTLYAASVSRTSTGSALGNPPISTTGVGDYIAAGLGIGATTSHDLERSSYHSSRPLDTALSSTFLSDIHSGPGHLASTLLLPTAVPFTGNANPNVSLGYARTSSASATGTALIDYTTGSLPVSLGVTATFNGTGYARPTNSSVARQGATGTVISHEPGLMVNVGTGTESYYRPPIAVQEVGSIILPTVPTTGTTSSLAVTASQSPISAAGTTNAVPEEVNANTPSETGKVASNKQATRITAVADTLSTSTASAYLSQSAHGKDGGSSSSTIASSAGAAISTKASDGVSSSGDASNGSPQSAAATTLVVSSQTITVISLGSGGTLVANGGSTATLTPGQAATSFNGVEITAGSATVVIGSSGSQPETSSAHISSPESSTAVIGSQTLANLAQTNDASQLADGSSSPVSSQGAMSVLSNGQTLTAGSSETVVTGSQILYFAPTSALGSPYSVIQVGQIAYTAVGQSDGVQIFANAQASFTVSPGGPAVTLDGYTITDEFVAQTVAANHAHNVSPTPSGSQPLGTTQIGGQTYTEVSRDNSVGVFADAETTITLSAGSPATYLAGHPTSAASSDEIIVSGLTYYASPAAAANPSAIEIDSLSFTEIAQSDGIEVFANVLSTLTMSVGGSANSGDTLGVSTVDASEVLIDTTTSDFIPVETAFSTGSQTATANRDSDSKKVIILGSSVVTLSPGGPAKTVGSDVFSEAINGAVFRLTSTLVPAETTFIVGLQTATASRNSNGEEVIVLGSSVVTLSPGGPAKTVGSEMFTEASNGAAFEMTSTLVPVETTFTVGSYTVTVSRDSDGDQIIALGTSVVTLSPGGAAKTVGSEMFSEASNGAVLRVTSTQRTVAPSGSAAKPSASGTGAKSANSGALYTEVRYRHLMLAMGLVWSFR